MLKMFTHKARKIFFMIYCVFSFQFINPNIDKINGKKF